MANKDNKIMRRRLANAYLSSVISISLVLLLVGVASMLLVNAKSVSDYFKENMQVSVMMKQDVSEDDALKYMKKLEGETFIKSLDFISKEQGQQEMAEMLGEDFLDVFETSPIPASINVTLEAAYVSTDSLEIVKGKIASSSLVEEVVYQTSLVDALNANLSKISLILAVFIGLMLFISFVLINNTVRLNVFARRFTIHTMKLVGATIVLVGLLYFVRSEFVQLFEIFRLELLLLVIGIVIVAGVVICLLSTWLVVNKLVSLKKDELYY